MATKRLTTSQVNAIAKIADKKIRAENDERSRTVSRMRSELINSLLEHHDDLKEMFNKFPTSHNYIVQYLEWKYSERFDQLKLSLPKVIRIFYEFESAVKAQTHVLSTSITDGEELMSRVIDGFLNSSGNDNWH